MIEHQTWRFTVLLSVVGIASQTANAQTWTQFEMNRHAADGRYLWTAAENWTSGLPNAELCVEIGDDHSGQALHCVTPWGAKRRAAILN